MALDYHFTCPLEHGLHARPATQLARIAGRFTALITLTNERTNAEADVSSVLSIVSAAVLHGDRCRICFEGRDQALARAALAEFIDRELAHCDAPLASPPRTAAARPPRIQDAAELHWHPGVVLGRGLGVGRIVRLEAMSLPEELELPAAQSQATERMRLDEAIASVDNALEALLHSATSSVERDLAETSLSMLHDSHLRAALQMEIIRGAPAEQAVLLAARRFSSQLAASASSYLRERQMDIELIGLRLLGRLTGRELATSGVRLSEPSIVCAPEINPAQLLALDRSLLRGLVLAAAGGTSHSVILARAMGIPVLGAVAILSELQDGEDAVVDARAGILVTRLSAAVRDYYERELQAERQRRSRLQAATRLPATTLDGRRIEVAANISTAEEAAPAFEFGAEGIGLFRTEMLYSASDTPPGEDEQFAVYAQVVRAAQGRTVIIRSFDVGGDKPLPYLHLPAETNPFLGYRGVRMYADHTSLITAQLRAICRASALGPVRLMAPMVATVDEARLFRHRVIDIQLELKAQGIAIDERMPVGIMLEVPSSALCVTALSNVCDFFSIGSNDLSQYVFAADRGNPKVAELNSERHPAFLRLLKLACDEARLQERWIGLCGEMARDPRNTPLLAGLGLDELSLAAPQVVAVKRAVAGLDSRECRLLLEQCIASSALAEVEALLDSFTASTPQQALLAAELLVLDSAAASKEQAMRELTLLLYAHGRTDDPDALEDALWAREAEFSTGLGHGMAIPHCKTAAVKASTLTVLRLRQALDWEALDGAPVDTLIMLVMPENAAREHLQVFAQLARKLMDAGFRAALRSAADATELLELLQRELELA